MIFAVKFTSLKWKEKIIYNWSYENVHVSERFNCWVRKILRQPYTYTFIVYSYLKDSIGSIFAAFQAGYIPNPIPITEQTARPIKAQSKGMTAGILKIAATTFPPATPKIIPTIRSGKRKLFIIDHMKRYIYQRVSAVE